MAPDENLRQFATDTQWEFYTAYCETGAYNAAARALGKDVSQIRFAVKRVQEKALRAGYAPEDFRVYKVSTSRNADGEITATHVNVRAAADDQKTAHIPDPKKIVKTSTLFSGDGSITQQWVMEKPEDRQREELWRAFAEGLAADLPRVAPRPAPEFERDELATIYPVGDHHMGMLAWGLETGDENYDVKIGEKLLHDAVDYLVRTAPATQRAVIPFLGDFLHIDGYAPMTPASGHLLDADSRFPKIAWAAARTMRRVIDTTLTKHQNVDVFVIDGNHDPVSTIWLRIALAAAYENEPRVLIHTEPTKFQYFEWGRNLLGLTHGDRIKIDGLPAIMANDKPEAWGRTAHRFWLTGHVHHDKIKDLVGAKVESVRILAPNDAYSAKSGYRTPRDMKAIVLHREWGETGRYIAPAPMFQVPS